VSDAHALELGSAARSVAEVERRLAQLRRSMADDPHYGTRLLARASVLNLVVYAPRQSHAVRAARTVGVLAERHPSRAIVLFHDEAGRREIDADVTLHCHLPRVGGRHLCFEQIVVETRRAAGHRLRSIVIPLLIPDLPTFLWWTESPPIGEDRFADLLDLADRLIVDSADFARPEVSLPAILELADANRGRFGLTDFNWTRLTRWRELIAQFFDVPEWRPYLEGVDGVRVGFAVDMDGRAIHPSQALLLVGWLSGRLGWHALEELAPSEAGGLLFRLGRADRGSLAVRIRPRFLRGIDEGDLTGVRILASSGGRRAEFVLKRAEDGTPHVSTEVLVDGVSVMRRIVLLPTPSVVDLLGEELGITRGDAIYEEALTALCDMTGATPPGQTADRADKRGRGSPARVTYGG
jgi:glucose-6-phosphate dehydrogenase assembly protein OpcA